MMWIVVSTLLLSPSVVSVNTAFHLHNYLNHSVSPCSDFYTHVCSSGMHLNETLKYKSEQFYRDLAAKLDSRSREGPIMNDIISARESENCTFDDQSYKSNLQNRCGDVRQCYIDEFYYFFNMYNITIEKVEDTLTFFALRANNTNISIQKIMGITSKMIEVMIRDSEEKGVFEMVVSPYERLRDRLAIMSELGNDKIWDEVGLDRLRSMTNDLKDSIADRFFATPWLNDTDALDFDRLSQFLTILDEMTFMEDFDELDMNLTLWRSTDHFVTSKYFEYSTRSTGCTKFDIIHSFVTIQNEMGKRIRTGEDWQIFMRITRGLVYNAYNGFDFDAIILLAPMFYPIMDESSRETTMLAFSAIIGHEIFHSFIKSKLTNNSEVFKREADCVMNHFNASCQIWSESSCSSGQQTFEEDGPDLEGLRVAYDLLKRTYNDDELKEFEYEELEITREQAFFYALGARFCRAFEDNPHDEHSFVTVRLNALVSMMPEFTSAFGCEIGDEEYSDESSTCNLFGPQSGNHKDHHENNIGEYDRSGEEGISNVRELLTISK